MQKILFVCTGNTCRSCMAEGLFNHIVSADQHLKGKFTAFSAGVSAFDGDSASCNSVKVLSDGWGIDISTHKSRNLTARDISDAMLILTMTRGHRDIIISLYPQAKGNVYTLKEYVAEAKSEKNIDEYNYAIDILDPYGMPEAIYNKCAIEINEAICKLADILKKAR